MASESGFPFFRAVLAGALALAGFLVLFSMYYKSFPSPNCHPPPKQTNVANRSAEARQPAQQANKPLVLLWFWPQSKKFDLDVCKTHLHIDNCHLTDDRSLYSTAQAVVIHHKDIKEDLSNLPTSPRPKFQRWIWLNMDIPADTRKIAGLETLFNLTSSYRKDADIPVRWHLTIKKKAEQDFALPNKESLLCWIVDNPKKLDTETGEQYTYYQELKKHIKMSIFDSSSAKVKGQNYFKTISSCKFLLSFEESNEKDFITETFNGPLAAGTVPIAWGPQRKNYEKFVPATSFIHVSDFPDASALAEFLLKLDDDDEAYMKYFAWQNHYAASPHFTEENYKFALAICQACRHVGYTKEYRVVRDLYKWLSP